jgi:type IV pilus assembly protein PilA
MAIIVKGSSVDIKRHPGVAGHLDKLLKLRGLALHVTGHKLCKAFLGVVEVRIRLSAGFALVDLLFVCGIIGILSSIALPRLMTAKNSANAASAVGSIRTIGSGEVAFAITCGSGFYAPSLTALAKAPAGTSEGFIKADLGAADTIIKSSYSFTLSATAFGGAPDTCNAIGAGATGLAYKVGGDPLDVQNTPRYFASNAGNVIWEDTQPLFPMMPEAGDALSGTPLKY